MDITQYYDISDISFWHIEAKAKDNPDLGYRHIQ